MPSQLKSETARANGAKSHGPVTPEGRARSSRNSLRHGLSAKAVVLPGESRDDFQLLRQSYTDQFQPSTGLQMDLVEAMAVARWRLRRICTIETNLLTMEISRRAEDIDEEMSNMDDDYRLAWVFQQMANHQQGLALLVRYEGTLNRSHDRAFKQFNLIRTLQNRPRQNEPNPGPVPPASGS